LPDAATGLKEIGGAEMGVAKYKNARISNIVHHVVAVKPGNDPNEWQNILSAIMMP